MSTEQHGVSPATAGGAPTPNPATVDNSIAYALTHHYGFLPLNVRYRAAQVARAIVEQSKAEAPLAEILPAEERKPVYSEPGVDTDWDEDTDAQVIHGVGWSLSWGCKLSIARDHDTGEHYVCVNTSGEDQRKGIVSRSTTREQIASFGQQLLNVFGEPDPRDAEIDRLTRDLRACEITRNDARSQRDQARVERDNVTHAHDEWREEWKRADAEVTRLKRLVDNQSAEVTKDRDRWQANYNRLIGGALAVQQHLQRATGRLIHPSDQFDKDFSRSVVDELVADRDRLRVELERPLEFYGRLVARIRQALREEHDPVDCTAGVLKAELGRLVDVLEVEVAQHDQTKAARGRLRQELDLIHEKHAAGLVTLRTDFTAAVNGLLPKPAGPRRWVAGDPEPEIGTTVRYVNSITYPTFTRRTDGQWHCDAGTHDPNTCTESRMYTWKQITGRSALMPLFEVAANSKAGA